MNTLTCERVMILLPLYIEEKTSEMENFENEYAAFCCGTEKNVDYYDEDAELLKSEDINIRSISLTLETSQLDISPSNSDQ